MYYLIHNNIQSTQINSHKHFKHTHTHTSLTHKTLFLATLNTFKIFFFLKTFFIFCLYCVNSIHNNTHTQKIIIKITAPKKPRKREIYWLKDLKSELFIQIFKIYSLFYIHIRYHKMAVDGTLKPQSCVFLYSRISFTLSNRHFFFLKKTMYRKTLL